MTTTTETVAPTTRAQRRSGRALMLRHERYAESGFRDRSLPMPFVAHVQHAPFTIDELAERATARRDYKRHVQKALLLAKNTDSADRVFDNRAPHAMRGTTARKKADRRPERIRNKLALVTGQINNAKGLHADGSKMPLHYMHAAARAARYDQITYALAA